MRRARFVSLALAAALFLGAAPGAFAQELLANPGVEDAGSTGTGPAFWQTDAWGQNAPSFSWSLDAHTGAHSVRVGITQYASGDAKWMHAPIDVSGGSYYVFSDWYKSDRSSAISVYYETATDVPGEGQWANLFSGIPPASSWTLYRTAFTMPIGAVRAVFAHFIAGNGYLQTDDHSVQQLAAPPGFTRPLVSLTFDNASQPFYELALPLLAGRGLVTTQYVPTAGIAKHDVSLMTADELRALHAAGHEIGSHTVNHPYLTTVSDRTLLSELTSSRDYLQRMLGTQDVNAFAYPFGDYDARVIAATQAAGYTSGRSVEEGYNSKVGFEPFDIRVQNMTSNTTLAQFQSWVDYARAHRYWLVVVYHEVVPDSAPACTNPPVTSPCLGDWDTRLSSFDQQLAYLVSQGMAGDVHTVNEALATVTSELHAPSAGSVALSPAAPASDATVTATPQEFVDPDGDPLAYRYAWSVNGVAVAGAGGATLDLAPPGHGDPGEVVGVSVTAVDPAGHTSGAASAAVTVAQTAPIVAPPTPAPAPAPSPGTRSCRAGDRSGPRIAVTSPRRRAYHPGRITFRFSAQDVSGVAWIKAAVRMPSGRVQGVRHRGVLRLRRAGRYTLTVRAADRCGRRSAKIVPFRISRR